LLSNLFLFDGMSKLSGELQVSDGNIIKDDIELLSSLTQLLSYFKGDLFSLGKKLICVVLSHYLLEHLVSDRRDDSLIVVST
jgi:hypothetical protein